MQAEQVASALAGTALFASLDEGERRWLAERSTVRRCRRGQVVFGEGEPSDSLIVVLGGRLRVYVGSADGSELLLAVVGEGESIGEIGALDGKPRSASVDALVDSVVLRVPARTMHDLLDQSPKLVRGLLAALADLVRRQSSDAADLVFLDLPRRVAKLLVQRAIAPAGATLELGLNQGQIAAKVAGSRQSVNAALRGFHRRGWITVSGTTVQVHDLPALQRYVGD